MPEGLVEDAADRQAPGRGGVGRGRPAKAFWLRQMLQWHWISAAVSLVGMLAFALTGITLNHAADIAAQSVISERTMRLPPAVAAAVATAPATSDRAPLPPAATAWVRDAFGVETKGAVAEWSGDEVFIALPRPGGDATLTIDRAAGDAVYEDTDRGWIAYFNDLHKGRHAGAAWALFIDVFAGACVVFCLTGFALLWLKAVARPSTWPLIAAGVFIPAAIAALLIH